MKALASRIMIGFSIVEQIIQYEIYRLTQNQIVFIKQNQIVNNQRFFQFMLPHRSQSIQLIRVNEQTHCFELTEEASRFLCSLSRPIAIITIAGLYRTGKSFLINKLLSHKQRSNDSHPTGFKVGNTTESVTKGLNIWGKPISIYCEQMEEEIDYLLIDSEGIGSGDRESKYDTNLLILIFLISSTVVYNSIGAIDQLALQQLQVVLQLKQCINLQRSVSAPPKFVWVLRDFALQLIDKNGNQLTSNQYLEHCLEQSANTKSIEAKKKNQIRRGIKENLGERHCFTLVRPTQKEEDLQQLGTSKNKLRPEFVQQIEALKECLFTGSIQDIKKVNETKITGRLLDTMLREYLTVLNNDELPNVGNIWESVVKSRNQQILEECIEQVKKNLKYSITLPMPKGELKMRLNEIENRAYLQLESRMSGESMEMYFHQYQKQFIKEVQKLNKDLKQKNDELKSSNIMGILRTFVKENLVYEQLRPTTIGESMKTFIERVKTRVNGLEEGYEHLLSIIVDVFFIIEQKSLKADRELSQAKKVVENQSNDKKNQDLIMMNIKRQYHQALKTIAKLQESQAEIDKNYSLQKNRIRSQQQKIHLLESELNEVKQKNQMKFKQSEFKYQSKMEEFGSEVKRLKNEKKNLEEQLSEAIKNLGDKKSENRKETIFQQKIQECFQRFSKEKNGLMKEVQNWQKQAEEIKTKYAELNEKYLMEREERVKNDEQYRNKEKCFEQQFESLKKCIKDTQQSYELTYKTLHNNNQIFREISNLTGQKKERRFQNCSESRKRECEASDQIKGEKLLKNYFENQIQKIKEQTSMQVEKLAELLRKSEQQIQQQKAMKDNYCIEMKEYRSRCQKLEADIATANSKFNTCLQQIEEARENQRKIYEESIVRLLGNIERKDKERKPFSFYQTD